MQSIPRSCRGALRMPSRLAGPTSRVGRRRAHRGAGRRRRRAAGRRPGNENTGGRELHGVSSARGVLKVRCSDISHYNWTAQVPERVLPMSFIGII